MPRWAPTPADKPQQRQSPAPPPAIKDDEGLPRVLLIGDHGWGTRSGTDSAGYTLAVRALLKGRANVHRVSETGVHTGKGVASLDTWLGGEPLDVIHFNFGLHDLKRGDHGQPQVPVEEYEKNLRRIVTRLQQTGATLVWAFTTQIPAGVTRPRSPRPGRSWMTTAWW